MEIVGVIPARFASTRLPGKALLSETGRPLILHVIEAARRSQSLQRIIVATDDERIAQAVTDFGGEVMMTRTDHATGTDRVAEVAGRLDRPALSSIFRATSPRSPAMRSTWWSPCWQTTPRPRWPPSRRRSVTNRSTATQPASRSYSIGAAGHSTSRGARSPAIATAFPSPPRPCPRSHICTSVSTRTAANSCSIWARFPLPA